MEEDGQQPARRFAVYSGPYSRGTRLLSGVPSLVLDTLCNALNVGPPLPYNFVYLVGASQGCRNWPHTEGFPPWGAVLAPFFSPNALLNSMPTLLFLLF